MHFLEWCFGVGGPFLSMAFCYDGLERIERKLGSVGMAFVYLVFDTFLVPAFIEYCT